MPQRNSDSEQQGLTPREKLAEGLQRLRAESGLSLRDLSAKVGWDHTHLHAMEQGRSLGGPDLIEALDTVYGTTPMLKLLWDVAKEGVTAFREKYQRYMDYESRALSMQEYALSVVPGLLQTRAYARELLGASGWTGEELEGQVTARWERRAILTGPDPTDYRAIVDEAVLRRPLRDAEAWREQLAHLLAMAQLPNVTLQVLPLAAPLHGLHSTHTILLGLLDGRLVGYTEMAYSGDLAEEPKGVERLRLAYDRLRDLALPPWESVAFVERLMEDSRPCEPPATAAP